jgi:hypothetical protein
MIKNILIRRKESDTYLATVSRHHWSLWIMMKYCSFQPAVLKASSQLGIALFPSYLDHILSISCTF